MPRTPSARRDRCVGPRVAAHAGEVRHDPVDEPVRASLLGGEPPVPQRVLADPLDGLAGVLGDEARGPCPGCAAGPRACSSMSAAVPPMPDDPWCSSTREWASAYRLPGVPAESRNCPALAAQPIASVLTSLGMSRMTSWMASIAGTDPPGELIHRLMSRRGSSADSRSSWAQSRLPAASSRVVPSTMMRWCSSRVASSSSRPRRVGGGVAHAPSLRPVGGGRVPVLPTADLPRAAWRRRRAGPPLSQISRPRQASSRRPMVSPPSSPPSSVNPSRR